MEEQFQLWHAFHYCMVSLCYITHALQEVPVALWGLIPLLKKGFMQFFNFILSTWVWSWAVIIQLASNHTQIRLIRLLNSVSVVKGYESPPSQLILLHLFSLTHSNCRGRSHKLGTLCCLHSWEWNPHRCFPSREIWELSKDLERSLPKVTQEFLFQLFMQKKSQVDYLHEAITQDLLLLVSYMEGKASPFTQSLFIRLWC